MTLQEEVEKFAIELLTPYLLELQKIEVFEKQLFFEITVSENCLQFKSCQTIIETMHAHWQEENRKQENNKQDCRLELEFKDGLMLINLNQSYFLSLSDVQYLLTLIILSFRKKQGCAK